MICTLFVPTLSSTDEMLKFRRTCLLCLAWFYASQHTTIGDYEAAYYKHRLVWTCTKQDLNESPPTQGSKDLLCNIILGEKSGQTLLNIVVCYH